MQLPERPLSPEELLHDGPPVTPRLAATVVLLRDRADGLEVLMVQRHHEARFMGGVWVFPGGAVDPQDGEGDAGVRAAAERELFEETGIRLDGTLVAFSRWVTPRETRRRFDTWFFLAPAPTKYELALSTDELVDHRWVTPVEALRARQSNQMPMVFPTIKTLEVLQGYRSTTEAFTDSAAREIKPQEPRIVRDGVEARLVLPGDPGFPES